MKAASGILVSLTVLVSACGGTTQPPAATVALATPPRSQSQSTQLSAQVAARQPPTASTPVGMCIDAPEVDTSATRKRPEPCQPEYPDRRAVESLDSLALITRVDYQARGAVITLPTDSFFEPGSAELARNARLRLDEIATALAQQYGRDIQIAGFTDSLGDAEEGAALSLRRATAIRDYVVSKGANAQQIRVEGLGQKNPVADNATASGRYSNRRIEIVVDKRKPAAI